MRGDLGFISKASLKLFLNMVPSSPTDIVTTQLACFVVDEIACKVVWAVHVSETLVTRLAFSRPS